MATAGLNVEIRGTAAWQRGLKQLGEGRLRKLAKDSLNTVGFDMRDAMQHEFARVFDKPTKYIMRSPQVRMASSDDLSLAVGPDVRNRTRWASGGKGGVTPQKILQAQEWGGTRSDKKSEAALRRRGLLPPGYQTVIADPPFPGSDDGHGNLRGAFVQQMLSYLQLYSEEGYRANMTPRSRKRTERGTKKQSGRRYFVAGSRVESRMEGGEHKMGAVPLRGTSHLAPGIYAAQGRQLHPVLLFVRAPQYRPRLDMNDLAKAFDPAARFERIFGSKVDRALAALDE